MYLNSFTRIYLNEVRELKIIINYPTEKSGIEKLNEGIAEIKATLYIETIANLNVSEETKREILKSLIEELSR